MTRQPDPGPGATGAHRSGQVRIEEITVSFGGRQGRRRVLDRFSLDIRSGEFVCVLGPSGCGKSTVLNALAGFIWPDEGHVTVDGQPITGPGPDRGIVFQEPTLLPWKTVMQNVALGQVIAGNGSLSDAGARTFLGMVGLADFEKHYPAQLSGGMQQRVGIARALANYPRVLLMDEPFGALDAQTRILMQEALLGVWSEFRTSVLFITHDIDEAIFLADRVVVMGSSPGRIVADIPIELPRPRDARMQFTDAFQHVKKQCFELISAQSWGRRPRQGPDLHYTNLH